MICALVRMWVCLCVILHNEYVGPVLATSHSDWVKLIKWLLKAYLPLYMIYRIMSYPGISVFALYLLQYLACRAAKRAGLSVHSYACTCPSALMYFCPISR